MADSTPPNTHEVMFSIDLPVSQDRAWRALTTEINTWWPADFRATQR